MKVVLASSSPYRAQLLSEIVTDFSAHAGEIDEEAVMNSGQEPGAIVTILARQKAQSVAKHYSPETIIIGGDQVASFEGQIIGKPGSLERARDRLSRLSGQTHQLFTATCICVGSDTYEDLNITSFKMKSLSESQIEDYLRLDNPIDCAGAYKYEKNGKSLFEKVETSDESAITGLPLIWLKSQLETLL